MREPKISFVNELEAQNINDLRRLQSYIIILLNYKSQLALFHMVSFMVVPKYARHEGFVTVQFAYSYEHFLTVCAAGAQTC